MDREIPIWQIQLELFKSCTFNICIQFKLWQKQALIYIVKCYSQVQDHEESRITGNKT